LGEIEQAPPLLTNLRRAYEALLGHDFLSHAFYLQVTGLFVDLGVARDAGMNSTEIKALSAGVNELFKKIPREVRKEIREIVKDFGCLDFLQKPKSKSPSSVEAQPLTSSYHPWREKKRKTSGRGGNNGGRRIRPN